MLVPSPLHVCLCIMSQCCLPLEEVEDIRFLPLRGWGSSGARDVHTYMHMCTWLPPGCPLGHCLFGFTKLFAILKSNAYCNLLQKSAKCMIICICRERESESESE